VQKSDGINPFSYTPTSEVLPEGFLSKLMKKDEEFL
jgi:hypothetical protein